MPYKRMISTIFDASLIYVMPQAASISNHRADYHTQRMGSRQAGAAYFECIGPTECIVADRYMCRRAEELSAELE